MSSLDGPNTKNSSAKTANAGRATSRVIAFENIQPAPTALPEVPYKSAVEARLSKPSPRWQKAMQGTVEACSSYHGQLVAGVEFHPVLEAVHRAFLDHRPLCLSPDMLWLLVAQGFANHVNANAEALRSQFVKHTGKVEIRVFRDDFVKGSPENPWAETFDEFSNQIRKQIGAKTHDLLLPNFSTTGVTERAAAQVVLLDAMQSYFAYTLATRCGIPQIVLEGVPDDWRMLVQRTQSLGQFGLEWWTATLVPILERFVAASQGEVDERFWQSIYKLGGGSGGPYLSGWMIAFFPYLKDSESGLVKHKNYWIGGGKKWLQELLARSEESEAYQVDLVGPTTDVFPSGLAKVPFIWKYLGKSFNMEFLGGFVGIRQDSETLCLRPEIGWAVRDLTLIRSLEAAEQAAEDAARVAQQAANQEARARWEAAERARIAAWPPCPYCGAQLRSGKAKQCLECGMDWHDAANVVRRGAK